MPLSPCHDLICQQSDPLSDNIENTDSDIQIDRKVEPDTGVVTERIGVVLIEFNAGGLICLSLEELLLLRKCGRAGCNQKPLLLRTLSNGHRNKSRVILQLRTLPQCRLSPESVGHLLPHIDNTSKVPIGQSKIPIVRYVTHLPLKRTLAVRLIQYK